MPGYKTHIAWGVSAGVGLGFVAKTFYGVSLPQAVFGGVLCALGSVLPDVDSESSKANQRIMSIVSGSFSLLLANRLSFFDLAAESIVTISAAAYLFIYYIIGGIVKKMTVHRGMCHSIPFAVIAGELIFIMSVGSTQLRLYKAACIFIGVMVHLILDELFSVNLISDGASRKSNSDYYGSNRYGNRNLNRYQTSRTTRVKKSFGTALKLIDYKHMGATIVFYVAAVFLGNAAMNVQSMLTNLGDANANAARGTAVINRAKAKYPDQYDLSVVQWLAENDLVLAPSDLATVPDPNAVSQNKKWHDLKDITTIVENAASDVQLTLLDVVNVNSAATPKPQNLESPGSRRRRHRKDKSADSSENSPESKSSNKT